MAAILVILLWEFCYIFLQNFKEISIYIKNYSNNKISVICENNNMVILRDIRKVRRKYRYLTEAMKEYNQVFGLFFLVYVFGITCHVLVTIDLIVTQFRQQIINRRIIVSEISIVLSNLVSIVFSYNTQWRSELY